MGPKRAPLNATECKDAKGAFVYRLCRIGETPWTLRQPQDLSNASFSELRALLVSAIAMGNQQAHTSVFLHSTSSLGKIQKILDERRSLYTNWLVRWPKHLKNVDNVAPQNWAAHQREARLNKGQDKGKDKGEGKGDRGQGQLWQAPWHVSPRPCFQG